MTRRDGRPTSSVRRSARQCRPGHPAIPPRRTSRPLTFLRRLPRPGVGCRPAPRSVSRSESAWSRSSSCPSSLPSPSRSSRVRRPGLRRPARPSSCRTGSAPSGGSVGVRTSWSGSRPGPCRRTGARRRHGRRPTRRGRSDLVHQLVLCLCASHRRRVWLFRPGSGHPFPRVRASERRLGCRVDLLPSPTLCLASTTSGRVSRFDGSSWSSPQSLFAGDEVIRVDCPTTTFFLALSRLGDSRTFNGTTWSPHVGQGVVPILGTTSMSCGSATSCLVGGTFDNR